MQARVDICGQMKTHVNMCKRMYAQLTDWPPSIVSFSTYLYNISICIFVYYKLRTVPIWFLPIDENTGLIWRPMWGEMQQQSPDASVFGKPWIVFGVSWRRNTWISCLGFWWKKSIVDPCRFLIQHLMLTKVWGNFTLTQQWFLTSGFWWNRWTWRVVVIFEASEFKEMNRVHRNQVTHSARPTSHHNWPIY